MPTTKKVKLHWTVQLNQIGACSEGIGWAKTFKSAQAAWDACDEPDWMLWVLGELDESPANSPTRRKYVAIACASARLVLANFSIEQLESAAASARSAARKQCCDHIRKEFPKPPKIPRTRHK